MKAGTHSLLWLIGGIACYWIASWSGPEAVTNRDIAFLFCLGLAELWTVVRYIKGE